MIQATKRLHLNKQSSLVMIPKLGYSTMTQAVRHWINLNRYWKMGPMAHQTIGVTPEQASAIIQRMM